MLYNDTKVSFGCLSCPTYAGAWSFTQFSYAFQGDHFRHIAVQGVQQRLTPRTLLFSTMASITYRSDNRWNKPAITLPGSEKWDLIDRHYVRKGLLAELAGQQMMFLDTANYWIPLVSKTAALRVSQVIGNENASVNYGGSFEPYYGKMSKACSSNSFTYTPVSTCVGTERLSIELDKATRTLKFDVAAPYPISHAGSIPPFIHGLCFQPTDHITVPELYVFPGLGTILDFVRPLFPDVRSMITYMWAIGNAARDPIARPRCVMLCGPGGSGKSTMLRMATSAMQGVTNLIPDNILTRDHPSLGEKVAQTVIKSRLVTCYELDLNKYEINMSMFKNITGSDYVKVGEFMSKAVCSFAIATNGIPDISRQPELTEDSISRRLVCVKMNVDTAEAPYQPDPARDLDKVDFHCACLYIRMCYQDLPISPDNLLLSLCLSKYHEALKYIDVDCGNSVSVLDGKAVISTIAAVLDTAEYRVIERCRLISMSSLTNTPLGEIIKGMKCRG